MSASRIPVPSAPGRIGRTEEMRRSFEEQIRAKEAAAAKRRELFNALSHFVQASRAGWVTSPPGDSPIRIEALPDGDLIDQLLDRGFNIQSLGTGEHIDGGFIRPVCLYALHLPPLPR